LKEFWEDSLKLNPEKALLQQRLKNPQFFLISKLLMTDSRVLSDKKMHKFKFSETKLPKFKLPEPFHQLKVKVK